MTCASGGTAPDYEGYGYDQNGNRTSLRLRSGETIAFTFDPLNRQTVKDIPGGSAADVYTAYDLAGRVLSSRFVSTGGQGLIYTYDAAGRMLSEQSTIGTSRTLSYQYDAASNRTRITWPDAQYVTYTYDALNRVDLIRESGTTTLADYNYDTLGRRATLTRGNGAVSTFSYDLASRLTGLGLNLTGTANDQTYTFSYTNASQISQRTSTNDLYTWTTPAASKAYTRNGLNQYTAVSGTGFTYDQRGNLTSDGTRTFGYDYENRLASVSGSGSMTLAYDPGGRLRQTVAGASTTQFLYGGKALLAEYDGAGTLLRRYVHGPGIDEPLVWYEGAGLTDRRYLIADRQGSIIAANGASTTRYTYGPYGEPNTWAGSRFRYTGQIALPEVALYHYKARAYDPVLGRFLQTDPVGYADQMNLYAYVGNDPLNASDPSGECSVGEDGRRVGVCPKDISSFVTVVKAMLTGYDGVQRTNELATEKGVEVAISTDATAMGDNVTYDHFDPGAPTDVNIVLGGRPGGIGYFEDTETGEIYGRQTDPGPEQLSHALGHAIDGVTGQRGTIEYLNKVLRVPEPNPDIPRSETSAVREQNKYLEAIGSSERRIAY